MGNISRKKPSHLLNHEILQSGWNLQGFLSQELLSSREMSKDESPSPGPMESNGVMDRRQDFWGFMLPSGKLT